MLVRIVTDKGIPPLEGFTPEYRRRCTVSVHLVSRYTLCGALGFLFGNRTDRERAPNGFVINLPEKTLGKLFFNTMVSSIVELVGGKENIRSFAHCVTRLRLNVKD